MHAFQFESGKVMIKRRRRPTRGCVTGTAIGAQPALMGILPGMAGEAVLSCGLQVFRRPGTDMAIAASNLCVQACQWKNKLVVVKIVPIGVQSVVAG